MSIAPSLPVIVDPTPSVGIGVGVGVSVGRGVAVIGISVGVDWGMAVGLGVFVLQAVNQKNMARNEYKSGNKFFFNFILHKIYLNETKAKIIENTELALTQAASQCFAPADSGAGMVSAKI